MKQDIGALLQRAERDLAEIFAGFERTEERATRRVLDAFAPHRVAARHFAPSPGYGYDDVGRDTLEALCADIFPPEAAICRPMLASGTHPTPVSLFGLLLPGVELLIITGAPYDTLAGVIGTKREPGSLMELGVTSRVVGLDGQGAIDVPAALAALRPNTRVAFLQRSRGYALRPSLMPEDICLLYTSPSPRDRTRSRMPSSA